MKQKLSCLTLSIALLASSNWCNATNRYVSAGCDGDGLSWATAKGSIKSAVESCHTGDTVFVSSGLYNEYVSIVDGVNILGGYNADTGARNIETFETILDGTGLGKYLIVKYDSPCENPTLIEGLTLQNAEHSSDGGAAYIRANRRSGARRRAPAGGCRTPPGGPSPPRRAAPPSRAGAAPPR